MKLTPEQREVLVAYLADACMDNMFGDGLERDYVMDGFPEWKGLANMTDQELLDEALIETEEDLEEFLNNEGELE